MHTSRLKFALIVAPFLLSMTLSHTVNADPIGYLVNEAMEYILYGQDEEQPTQTHNPLRQIPQNSETGYLSPTTQGNLVEINGEEHTLAMNSRIRDEHNRIVQTSMIRQEKRIRYTLNNLEQVDRIWLLTPGEE